jgi:HAD superfamily hydrolase (TIGR01662 family)
MKRPRQCAILVGGLGTRLGLLAAETPKPLLNCGDRPFLAWLLRELCRFGIQEVVLLAGHKPDRILHFTKDVASSLPKDIVIKVSIEDAPAGTGGALWHARDMLDKYFLLINGDSWFDANLARFLAGAMSAFDSCGHVLLRWVSDTARYGVVELHGQRITDFCERRPLTSGGIINSGIYVFDKSIFEFITPRCSLEGDILPILVTKGRLSGQILDGYFIDIGVPADYAGAQEELPRRLKRPAVFFDSDAVLDRGWVASNERFRWTEGAKDAIRLVNDVGLHAFLISNQAGVARDLHAANEIEILHNHIMEDLWANGATIDDFRYFPFDPNAPVDTCRLDSNLRQPSHGMIIDLMKKWCVEIPGTFLVGDKEANLQAATAAQIAGRMFSGGNLYDFVRSCLFLDRNGDTGSYGR